MSLLELGGKKFTIPVGEVALGSDPACAIRLTGAAVLPRHAVFQGQPDGQVVIRKAAPAAEVLINGVRLAPGRTGEHTAETPAQAKILCRPLLGKKKTDNTQTHLKQ